MPYGRFFRQIFCIVCRAPWLQKKTKSVMNSKKQGVEEFESQNRQVWVIFFVSFWLGVILLLGILAERRRLGALPAW